MEESRILSGEPDLSIVDRVPWAELDHAYGAAIDVPSQFQALVSPVAEVRRRTIWGFYGNLFHQRSVYPATVAAIPVFQYLLRYKQVAEKPRILELLASFAVQCPDELIENVDLAKFIGGTSDNSDSEDDTDARECYLAVGAGVPLYELLFRDPDPRVVISAAFTLAFFPAHAFASCRALLAIARDDSQHAFVRSSAVIACSYLDGGPLREDFLQLLRALVEGKEPDEEKAMPLLAATAVYCLIRDKQNLDEERLRSRSERLAVRCIQHGIQLPECNFYRTKAGDAVEDVSKVDYMEVLMPAAQFPWGDLSKRIRQHTIVGKQGEADMQAEREIAVPQKREGPDPASFDVKPDVFDRDNVIAAVRRLHANFFGLQEGVPQAVKEFEPFKPHVMLAWDEVLRLLDSRVRKDRRAASSMIEHFGPLDEAAVDQLIERLHRVGNNELGNAIKSLSVSERQCQLISDRLCGGDSVRPEYRSASNDYLAIVIRHGTSDQLWELFEQGEFAEKASAADELWCRGQMEASVALPVFTEALVSSDYGLRMSASWAFGKWRSAQRWFFELYESLPPPQQWAIAEAMTTFHADLTEQQDALFARIETEKHPLLAAKLVRLIAQFESPQPTMVDRLLGLIDGNSSAVFRLAIVDTFGCWSGKNLDGIVSEHLKAFSTDASPRVRRAAIDHSAKFSLPSKWNIAIVRRALSDEDPDNRRHAMWHLSRQGELAVEDAGRLLSPDQPDRLAAETLLAAASSRSMLAVLEPSTVGRSTENRPLARSVWECISRI